MKSAYVDKIRISYCLQTNENDDLSQGVIFVASHDNALDSSTPANNDGNIISASATRGAGGVVTLPIQRRITVDYDGADTNVLNLLKGTSGAPIYLHMHKSKTGESVNYYLVVETWGRWFEQTSL